MSFFKPHNERFSIVAKVASELGRPIAFLDTETTGLLNRLPVGLVDLAVLVVDKTGKAMVLESLVDPGIPIPVEASKVHGLYAEHIAGAPSFDVFIPDLKEHFSSSVISGFNSRKYDIPVLLHNMERYGQPGETPQLQLDTRELWTRHERTQKGKLGEIAEKIGIERGTAHRALGDVLTTIRIFEAMVSARGIDWLKEITPETFGGGKYVYKIKTTPEIAAIREAVSSGKLLTPGTINEISISKKLHITALSFAVSDLLKSGEVSFEQCADPKCQERIRPVLDHALSKVSLAKGDKSVRLKPLKDLLDILNGQNNDYNQIRVALAARKDAERTTEMVR